MKIYLRKYKPKTPSLRFKIDIYKMTPLLDKSKLFSIKFKNKSGRSKYGTTILRNRCYNKFNTFIKVNLNREYLNLFAIIVSLNYISKNSCFIGLIKYSNGSMSYIKLVSGLFLGDYTKSIYAVSKVIHNFKSILGSYIVLILAPIHFVFSNIVDANSNISKYVRAAGTFLSISKQMDEYEVFVINLPTGTNKYFSINSRATIGRNSNTLNSYTYIGKAGINRSKGIKPSVRGVAMNPVDHPHGGRTKTNQPEVSPWGWVTKINK